MRFELIHILYRIQRYDTRGVASNLIGRAPLYAEAAEAVAEGACSICKEVSLL